MRRKARDRDGLYKRKDSPYWWISFTVDGTQYQRSTRTADEKTARKILAKVQTQVIEGKWFGKREKPQYTFRELAEKYIEWCRGRQKTSDWTQRVIKRFIVRFGNTKIEDFNTHMIERFQSEFLERGRKPATVNRYIAIISHMFTKAHEWEMCSEGTLSRIRKAKRLKENNKRLRYLQREECQALIAACRPKIRPIVITALNTGMRKSEILNLKWEDIDLKHGFILLESSKTKNSERREVPINDTLRRTLLEIPRRLDVPYVFYNPRTGKPYRNIFRSFHNTCRRLGFHDFHFHDLRHTFASHLVMAGVDLTTVKELLGHKDIKMTLRYAHLAPSHKVEAVKKYDNFLNSKAAPAGRKNEAHNYELMTLVDEKLKGYL